MASPRCLLLAAIPAALVVTAAVYTALGLTIRSYGQDPPDWLIARITSERYERWRDSYALVCDALFPGDHDADGASDGLEWFEQTDPRDPESMPGSSNRWLSAAPATIDRNARYDFDEYQRSQAEDNFLVNQRRRIVGKLRFNDSTVGFPRGFQLRFEVCEGWLASPPGGTLSSKPFLLPVARDGTIAFDIEPAENAPVRVAPLWSYSEVQRLSSSGLAATLGGWAVWPRQPSITPTSIEKLLPGQVSAVDGKPAPLHLAGEKSPVYRLRWTAPGPAAAPGSAAMDAESLAKAAEAVMVEAAASTEPDAWVPIAICDSRATTCDVLLLTDPPPHFRITPFRRSSAAAN